MCSMKMSTKGMRLRSFTASEKLRIVREAEEIGNRAAGRKYDVPESCMRD
jgi:transposase-like protein